MLKPEVGFLLLSMRQKKAVDEVRLLAERAFYLSKRLPFLMQWQVRSTIDETMSSSAVSQIADAVPQVAQAIDRLPQDLATERQAAFADIAKERQAVFADLSKERQAIFADFRNTEPLANNLFAKYRSAIADTSSLTSNVRGVSGDVKRITGNVTVQEM